MAARRVAESAAIILAAGKSTRMSSDLPKVLHDICGRPMLAHVISACRLAGVDRLVVVVGHGKDQVIQAFAADRDVTWVSQDEQHGTGHAVLCCKNALSGMSGSVVVVAGDMPLIQRETIAELLEARERSGDALTLATAELDDPSGYGRIIRDADGRIRGIVEHKDCTDEQLTIAEVNPSFYCFEAQQLLTVLEELRPSPGGELYITDTVALLRAKGQGVSATVQVEPEEALGINTRVSLVQVSRTMQDRIQWRLLNEGVTIVDPDNTWIEADASVGRDSVILPFSFVGCGATIGAGCRVGPFAYVAGGETVGDGVDVFRNAILKSGER